MNPLTGEYLQAYQKVEVLCQNLSFFMNDDHYFQISILEEVLDLLTEAEANHQSVEFVLGNDYELFIKERYKECSAYDFSFGTMAIMFILVYFSLITIFPHLFKTHRMETEYYMFLLFPILARIFYSFNQTIFMNMFYKCSQKSIDIIENIFAGIGIIIVAVIGFVLMQYLKPHTMGIWLSFTYFGVQKKSGIIFDKRAIAVYTFFIIEIALAIFGFGFLSQFISPLVTNGNFQWFIPILLCVIYARVPFSKMSWKIVFENNEDELCEYYLSHCHFLKVKRRMMKDHLLTNQDYFLKLQKRNKLFQKTTPIIVVIFIISMGMFIWSFQMSIFYIIIVDYGILGIIYFYRFAKITKKIERICKENL